MRPVLFYTIGYPGAGKTTLARSLATLLQIEHLRGDKIGLELFRFPTFSPAERQMVYAEMSRRSAEHLKAGRHVLYDAATNTRGQRTALEQLARAHGGQAIGLWLQTPHELAKKRAATVRDSGLVGQVARVIPPHLFEQYVAAFEPPVQEVVVTLSGDAPFYLQYRRLQRTLQGRVPLPRLV
ncbi:MAG TPA: ATP-binding protein [Candidatus Saccharimonadales bacterium]|nr:ATP-binding protein [Candidatus Saccharimonadales bacterium]